MRDNVHDPERRELRELQQFVLNRKTSNMRGELYEFLICRVILEHQVNGKIRKDQIASLIEYDFKLTKLPSIHLDKAFTSLMKDGHVNLDSDGTVTLSEKRKSILLQRTTDYDSLQSAVHEQLEDRIKRRAPSLTGPEIRQFIANFYAFLGSTFAKYGILSARILGGKTGKTSEFKDYPEFDDIYKSSVFSSLSDALQQSLKEEFNNFFFDPSPELCKFFFAMAQSYVLIEVLNLDPELNNLQRKAWSKKKIYLDTNLIIALLFKGDRTHDSVEALLRYTKELGAVITYSYETKKEYLRWLNNNKSAQIPLDGNKSRFAKTIVEMNRADPFLATYFLEQAANSQLSVQGFLVKYQNVATLLENRYAIKMDEKSPKKLNKNEYIQDLTDCVKGRKPDKGSSVVNHDVHNILSIHEMRKMDKSDSLGPSSWFLTNDYRLLHAEEDIFGPGTVPASITTDAWLQLISPLLSPQVASGDAAIVFAQLLSSRLTATYLDPRDVVVLMSLFMDDEDFSTEQLKRIIGDNYVLESIANAREALVQGKDEAIPSIMQPLIAKVKAEIAVNVKESVTVEYEDRIKNLKNEYDEKIANSGSELRHELESEYREKAEKLSTQQSSEIDDLNSRLANLEKKYDLLSKEKEQIESSLAYKLAKMLTGTKTQTKES